MSSILIFPTSWLYGLMCPRARSGLSEWLLDYCCSLQASLAFFQFHNQLIRVLLIFQENFFAHHKNDLIYGGIAPLTVLTSCYQIAVSQPSFAVLAVNICFRTEKKMARKVLQFKVIISTSKELARKLLSWLVEQRQQETKTVFFTVSALACLYNEIFWPTFLSSKVPLIALSLASVINGTLACPR